MSRAHVLPLAVLSGAMLLAPAVVRAADPAPAAPAAPSGPARPDADGFIRDWLLLGPIFYEGTWPAGEAEVDRQVVAGEGALRPKAGATTKAGDTTLTWKAVQSPNFDLDIGATLGLEGDALKYKTSYAVTYVVADAAVRNARLRVGSSDLLKMYWNGKPVISYKNTRPLRKDQNAAAIDIKKGVNVLVAKVINDEREWGVAARIVMSGGTPVPGIKVATSPDGQGALTALDGGGFVRDWLLAGPVPYKTRPYALGQLSTKQIKGEPELQPKPGQRTWANTGELPWTVYQAKDYFIDFDAFQKTMRNYTPPARVEKHNDTLFRVLGYAVTYVNAEQDLKDVSAKIGANDHGILYVNGKEVARSEAPGALQKDKASGKVALKKGVNTLMFKVVNAGDAWSGCVRFVGKDGKPVTNLEVTTTPPLTAEQRLAID